MAAIFIVEDGSGKSDATALISEAYATQYHENHSAPTAWTSADQVTHENAIREATQFLDTHYTWKQRRTHDEQALQWPRSYMEDKDGFAIASDEIHVHVKDACAILALAVINGDTLMPDQQNESAVKKTKDVIGPLTEEIEYVAGETPEKKYTLVDKLVAPFISGSHYGVVELTRA